MIPNTTRIRPAGHFCLSSACPAAVPRRLAPAGAGGVPPSQPACPYHPLRGTRAAAPLSRRMGCGSPSDRSPARRPTWNRRGDRVFGTIWLIPPRCSIFDYFPVAGPGLPDRARCGAGPHACLDTAQGRVHSESINTMLFISMEVFSKTFYLESCTPLCVGCPTTIVIARTYRARDGGGAPLLLRLSPWSGSVVSPAEESAPPPNADPAPRPRSEPQSPPLSCTPSLAMPGLLGSAEPPTGAARCFSASVAVAYKVARVVSGADRRTADVRGEGGEVGQAPVPAAFRRACSTPSSRPSIPPTRTHTPPSRPFTPSSRPSTALAAAVPPARSPLPL